MASMAWIEPMMPGSTPSTPASAHDGASSAGEAAGDMQREQGAAEGREAGGLAFEPEDRTVDHRDALEQRGVVDQVAGREVVGAVDDHVLAVDDVEHVV